MILAASPLALLSQPPTSICLWGTADSERRPLPDLAGAHMPHDITRPPGGSQLAYYVQVGLKLNPNSITDCWACCLLIANVHRHTETSTVRKWTDGIVPTSQSFSHVSSLSRSEPQFTADANSICLWLKPRIGRCRHWPSAIA